MLCYHKLSQLSLASSIARSQSPIQELGTSQRRLQGGCPGIYSGACVDRATYTNIICVLGWDWHQTSKGKVSILTVTGSQPRNFPVGIHEDVPQSPAPSNLPRPNM